MKEISQQAKKRHIILVDDDSDDRELFAEAVAFVDPTLRITMKNDGEELMDHLSSQEPTVDLIFLDLNMPRKNGRECLWEMRQEERFNKIPVIIYTTSLNPIDVEETFNNGAYRFLRKPNSFEELKEILHHILLSPFSFSGQRRRDEFVLTNQSMINQ